MFGFQFAVHQSTFLSTPSARRATRLWGLNPRPPDYFYPRPPRGGRRRNTALITVLVVISIHALREEGDLLERMAEKLQKISIHALREEGDGCKPAADRKRGHFYPRPPRGGRPAKTAQQTETKRISIHALREEGDP